MEKPSEKSGATKRGFLSENLWQIIILFVISLVYSLPSVIDYAGKPAIPRVGEIAQEDIIAPIKFDVLKPDSVIEAEKRAALRSVPVILNFDPNVRDSMLAVFDEKWKIIEKIKKKQNYNTKEKIDTLQKLLPNLNSQQLEQLMLVKDIGDFGKILKASLRIAYSKGFISSTPIPDEELPELFSIKRGKTEKTYPNSLVFNDSTILIEMEKYLERQYRNSPDRVGIGLEVVKNFLVPNLIPDMELTRANRDKAKAQIQPVKFHISKGEKIVGKHEKITPEIYQKLVSLYEARQKKSKGTSIISKILTTFGIFILSLLVVALFAIFVNIQYVEVWKNLKFFATIGASIIIVGIFAHIFRAIGLSNYSIPILFVSAVIVSIGDDWLAFVSSLTTLMLIGVGFRASATVMIAYSIALSIVSFKARSVHLKNLFYRPVLFSALAGLFTVIVLNAIMFSNWAEILRHCAEFGISTIISPFLALSLLPLAEKFSGRTSDFSLMDLSDINSILLRKLAVEAPGTFNHSILVGNTAAAAAEAIGANTIIARAGGYYHDIGKLIHPQYFEENQTGRNPHDNLSPFESYRILSSHTKEGVELGKLHNLPQIILDIIEQHHGTSVIEYFYRKAAEINPAVVADEFRYPGPKPQTVEAALVMICDSAEASIRSQKDNLPETEKEIKGIIENLIIEKIEDGQFDEAPISIADIKTAIDTIIPILRGIHHSRAAREFNL